MANDRLRLLKLRKRKLELEEPAAPTFLQKLQKVQEQVVDPALSQTPFGAALQAREDVNVLGDVAGEKVTESFTEKGIDPRIAAGAGTFVSSADEILELGLGGLGAKGAIQKGAKALARPVRRAFPREQSLKRGLQQAEAQVGIKQRAVSLRDVVDDLGIKTREKAVNASGKSTLKNVPEKELRKRVLNRVLDIREAGGTIPPESAKKLKVFFGDELKKGGGGNFIQKLLGQQKDSTLPEALTRRVEAFATKELNKGVPGREALSKAFGKVVRTKRKLKGAAKVGVGVAAAALFRKLFGVSQGFGG